MNKDARAMMIAQAEKTIELIQDEVKAFIMDEIGSKPQYDGLDYNDLVRLCSDKRNTTYQKQAVRKLIAHRESEMVKAYNNQLSLLEKRDAKSN